MSRTKYPWSTWTDGDVHRLIRGRDYTISTMNFQISVHGRAKTANKKVSTRSFTEHYRDKHGILRQCEGLILQFWDEDE